MPSLALGAGDMGEQVVRGAGPAAGPASPSRKHSSDVAQGNGLQEGTRHPCARGHRMRQPPLPTCGWSHRGASDSSRIQTSRGAHGQKPSRARESQGTRRHDGGSFGGPGAMSGSVLGVWGRFRPGKFWTFLSWRLCRAALWDESSSRAHFL